MKPAIAVALWGALVVFGNAAHAQCVGDPGPGGGAVDNRRSEGVSEQGITLGKSPPDVVVRIAHVNADMAQCAGKMMGAFAVDNSIVSAALGSARRTADAESTAGEVIFAVCRPAAKGSDVLLLGAASEARVVTRHLDILTRAIPGSQEGGASLQRQRRTSCRAPWHTYHGSGIDRGTMAQCIGAARAVVRNSSVASEDPTHFVLLAKDQQTTVAITCYQDGAGVAVLVAAVSFGGSQQGQKIYSAALDQLRAKLPIR